MQAVLSLPAPYISPFSSTLSHFYNRFYLVQSLKSIQMVQKVRQAILLPERKRFKMPKPRTQSGEKNLISQRLIELRRTHNMSQRDLAYKLPLAELKCSQFPSCVDFTGFNCIQNCVYCYYLSFFSKIALKHRPHYFHI